MKINNFYIKTTLEKLLNDLNSIDKNYKNYKKEWGLSVKQTKDNEFVISVNNKKQFIALNRGDFYAYMKRLYIRVIPQENHIVLEGRYKYPVFDFIIIKLIPMIFFIFFALCALLKITNIFENEWDWLLVLGIVSFGTLSVSDFFWIKGAKKLEKRRESVLVEILSKHNLFEI